MVKAEKKFILAYTHPQARHYAQSMDWKRDEWVFLSHPAMLKGMHSIVLYDVRTPKFKANAAEASKMTATRHEVDIAVTSGRIVRVNVVNLP